MVGAVCLAASGFIQFRLVEQPSVPKQLLFSEPARRKMLEGVDILAHAVGTTLGPTGRNVILSKSFGGPTVTKDGVTVSKEIELSRPVREHGSEAGERGCVEDVGRGRRRHDDGDDPGPRDLSRGAEEHHFGSESDGRSPRHREGCRGRGERADEAVATGLEEGRDRPGGHDLGEQRPDDRQPCWPMPSSGWAGTA